MDEKMVTVEMTNDQYKALFYKGEFRDLMNTAQMIKEVIDQFSDPGWNDEKLDKLQKEVSGDVLYLIKDVIALWFACYGEDAEINLQTREELFKSSRGW